MLFTVYYNKYFQRTYFLLFLQSIPKKFGPSQAHAALEKILQNLINYLFLGKNHRALKILTFDYPIPFITITTHIKHMIV